jgi:hypothetical protein
MNLLVFVLMNTAAIPNILAVRNSAIVNEERSISPQNLPKPSTFSLKILKWLKNRNFLLREVFLAIFLVVCILTSENQRFRNDPKMGLFPVLFESLSAYCSVGLSFGYPNTSTSLSAQFSDFAKYCMCIMFIAGRMKGLPTNLDKAYSFDVEIIHGNDDQVENDNKLVRVNSSLLRSEISLKSEIKSDVFVGRHMDSEGQKRIIKVRKRTTDQSNP